MKNRREPIHGETEAAARQRCPGPREDGSRGVPSVSPSPWRRKPLRDLREPLRPPSARRSTWDAPGGRGDARGAAGGAGRVTEGDGG